MMGNYEVSRGPGATCLTSPDAKRLVRQFGPCAQLPREGTASTAGPPVRNNTQFATHRKLGLFACSVPLYALKFPYFQLAQPAKPSLDGILCTLRDLVPLDNSAAAILPRIADGDAGQSPT